jgi:2-amino-4-hydroxy-6-hydroxymethyldihydropteridine diphosphokinase
MAAFQGETRCQIALGGNVGDVPATFAAALRRIEGPQLRVTAVSRLYETPPMGAHAGGTFLNAAATVVTTLGPTALLDRLLETEDVLGRVRTVRWGPRPLDLDLVLFGDAVIEIPRLRVPHPAFWLRRFVLDPLAEIAPDAVDPETGETVSTLRERIAVRPVRVAVVGPDEVAAEVRRSPGAEAVPVDARPALTLEVARDGASACDRVVGLPHEGAVATARAVLAAVLGEPRPASCAGWPPMLRGL